MKRAIPIWVTIVAALICLSALSFSIALYLVPGNFFPGTDFSAGGVKHFTDMVAIRTFSIGALLVYSLAAQNTAILKACLLLLLITSLLTIIDALSKGDFHTIFESLVYLGLAAAMLLGMKKPSVNV